MSFPDLRRFMDQLRQEGDLVEVRAPIDADQEAAEVHRRVVAAAGPALFFTNVKGGRVSPRDQPVWHTPSRRIGIW